MSDYNGVVRGTKEMEQSRLHTSDDPNFLPAP